MNHLQNINQNLSASYFLTSNLDLTNTSFTPLRGSTNPFTGSLNGSYLTLSNLTLNLPTTDNVGLFSTTGGSAVISNLNLVNFKITGQNYVGGLVGFSSGSGYISYVKVSGTIASDVTTTPSGTGGLIGAINGGSVAFCSSSAQILGAEGVGGLIGNAGQTSTTITRSNATGNVTGEMQCIGGLVGSVNNNASGTAGGVNLSRSYSTGKVVGTQGPNSGGGGLVGCIVYANNVISDSYATGSVNYASSGGGGLIGQQYFVNTVSVINTYATGSVYAGSFVGGLTGFCNGGCGTTQSSYYDVSTTGQSSSSDPGSSVESTAAMQTQATYSGWDFVNIWHPPVPGQSYPTLR